MSDAITCDGPDCMQAGVAPFLGWAHLSITGGSRRLDFCSWGCLGAFVMDAAGTVCAFEAELAELRGEKPADQ